MRTNPPIALRVPPDTHAWLKDRAARNHRSMTGELAEILAQQRRADEAPKAEALAKGAKP